MRALLRHQSQHIHRFERHFLRVLRVGVQTAGKQNPFDHFIQFIDITLNLGFALRLPRVVLDFEHFHIHANACERRA